MNRFGSDSFICGQGKIGHCTVKDVETNRYEELLHKFKFHKLTHLMKQKDVK